MSDTPPPLPRTLWLGMGFVLILLALAYLLSLAEVERSHKIKTALPVLGQIADFTLTNENGRVITLADLTNHVWIADIIFTRCAASCPVMTRQMKSLQDALGGFSDTNAAKLVSLTTDPDYDTPAVFQRYGEHYGADSNRWMFLTGTKSQLAALAAGNLKLGSTAIAPADQKSSVDLFIHSSIFVAVDKHARLRAIFETEGDGVDWSPQQQKILHVIRQLEQEP